MCEFSCYFVAIVLMNLHTSWHQTSTSIGAGEVCELSVLSSGSLGDRHKLWCRGREYRFLSLFEQRLKRTEGVWGDNEIESLLQIAACRSLWWGKLWHGDLEGVDSGTQVSADPRRIGSSLYMFRTR